MVSVPFTLLLAHWVKQVISFSIPWSHMYQSGLSMSWRYLVVYPYVSSTTALAKWSTMRSGRDREERGDKQRPARNLTGAGRRGDQ